MDAQETTAVFTAQSFIERAKRATIQKTDGRTPVNMIRIMAVMMTIFSNVYMVGNAISEEGIKTLVGMFEMAIFDGKDFKERLLSGSTKKTEGEELSDAEDADKVKPKKALPGSEIHLHKDVVFCSIIRGSEGDTETRSEVVKIDNSSIPVLTFKVFQAAISILVCYFNVQKELKPARLGANAVRTCKDPKSAPSAENWFVHAHSGIAFVGNYIWNVRKRPIDEKFTKERKEAMLRNLPSFPNLMMIIARMDQVLEKDALANSRKVNENSLMSSLVSTTGMTPVEMDIEKEAVKLITKNWDQIYLPKSNQLAKRFMRELSKFDVSPINVEGDDNAEPSRGGRTSQKGKKADEDPLSEMDFFMP